ncbi:carboxymuconolactone decarboxylase family protein [Nocardia alba]|uniref:AhpD family alkylhydroperoxidase n=1 Tax=Nocardia alba TaxID=225051 RepID=A0A4R1FSD4_9NOCA|nr:carboxymuconolactone decarboxylase family protein [Nocardia alba]TCJ96514.1 AhpD family alkylhydroperoxidase [Nocardia alba]
MTAAQEPRIAPLPKAEWSPEMTTFMAEYRSAAIGDKPSTGRQSGANLLGTLARYPALAKPFLTFNGHFLYGSTLSARQRELLVLRVAAVQRCGYEWAQHSILAADAGLEPEEIARIERGPSASGWSAIDGALLAAVDELLGDGAVSGPTWTALATEFDEHQLMDVVFTVGMYAMLAMALSSFAVAAEAALVPYLPAPE